WACTRSLSMSVLSTSNRKTTVLSIASQPAFVRPSILLALAEQLFGDLGDAPGLEPVFSQQLLERGRGAKCIHPDDAAGSADIAFPTEGRSLLHRHARSDVGRQHAVLVRLRLMFENIPGRHRDHARADTLREQLLVGVDTETDLAAGRDEDHFGLSRRRIGEHIGAARE